MKKLILLLLALSPLFVKAQTASLTASGYSFSLSPALTLTNTAVETTILNIPIKANTLANYKNVALSMYCHLSSGLVAPNITIRIKYGTGVVTVLSGLSVNISQTNRPFTLEGIIANMGATGTQYCYGLAKQSVLTGPLPLSSPNYDAYNIFSVDSTTDQNLTVTAQFSAAIPGTTLVVDYWKVNGEL